MIQEKFVRLTKPLLRKMFNECNEAYFDNRLPVPDYFETRTNSKYVAGWIHSIWDNKDWRWKTALHISRRLNWTEENLRDVMVHEMIHLELKDYLRPYRWWHRLFLTDHDKRFRERMSELNKKFGLNIMVKSKHLRTYIKEPDKK